MTGPAEPACRSGIDDTGPPSRRSVLFALPAVLTCATTRTAEAKPVEDYHDFRGPLPEVRFLGIRHPTRSEEAVADAILRRCPTSSPLHMMEYLERLTATNRDGEAYNAGWKTRWNPVIVAFFRETATRPSGDTTSWCAASLNWCLARAGYTGGTGSASSGSFRTVKGRTHHPRPGDIVVFGAADPVEYKSGRGHVGLYLAREADRILVLGGNQKNRFGHQAVCRKWIAVQDTTYHLNLQSFHSMRALT